MNSVGNIVDSTHVDIEDGELQEDSLCLYNETCEKQHDSPIEGPCGANSIFEIKFRNDVDYSRLQERIVDVISGAFKDQRFIFKANAAKLCIEVQEFIQDTQPTNEVQDGNYCNAEQDLFLIDTVPAHKLNASQIPSYKRCQIEVLDEKTPIRKKLKAEAVNKCFRPKLQASCFNCGESDHSLRECSRPRNNSRIQRARKKISRSERYHVDAEQRFGHIRAGRITTKTRHAMGYGRGELPFIFYRLRILGYPPAWLEEAKIQGSGITLFNADGSAVLQSDDEDGGDIDSFKYDLNKIIDFPGFNVQPSDKFFDDFQHHNVPRFKESQLKENFIKSLGDNVIKGYKRKKLINLPALRNESPSFCMAPSEDSTNCIQHDMEIIDDSEDPPSIKENTESLQHLPSNKKEHTRRLTSPTLEDLTAQQELLLQQLGSNATLHNVILTQTPKTKEVPPNTLKASYEGTPIIKFSVYDKLPIGDNFKVGVSDVINFENLPDSTGKYERMKDLLRNVRDKMTKLQNDDDE